MEEFSSNKRIAYNTIMLYIRMIFLLGVSFYTTRAILQTLGVVDLGIYNVVGGVVTMFSFISGSLSTASSRFITYSLGQGNIEELKNTFNSIVSVHFILGLLILLLAETIGFWFVLNKLVIPSDRMVSAVWVYQSSVFSAFLVVLSTPFNSIIIAHERMSAFAYISIYEALTKLFIVVLLSFIELDKLITYSLLLVLVQISVILIYINYCRKHFLESRFKMSWSFFRMKKIFSYTGWVMTGSFAFICCTQGLNILLNLFFGPAVNAARALANQLQGAVDRFTSNFQTAVTPQITISYAQGNIERMHTLVLASSKFGALLMLLLSVPIIIVTDFILDLWLGYVPNHTVEFVRIMLLVGIISAMKNPTMAAIHATGRIKKIEIVEMFSLLSIVPISYIMLYSFRATAEAVMFAYLLVEFYTQLLRVWIVYPEVGMKRVMFFTHVLYPVVVSCVVSIGISFLIKDFFSASFFNSLLSVVFSGLTTILVIFILGLSRYERKYLLSKLKRNS